jgi:hypothetical protein
MQGARLDQYEVGYERAELRQMLDAADQIGQRRMVLVDDRRARFRAIALLAVIDQQLT